MFHKSIGEDKVSLGLLSCVHPMPATYITIQRGKLFDGGYEQLSSLPVVSIKGIIRVHFVNAQVRFSTHYLLLSMALVAMIECVITCFKKIIGLVLIFIF